MIIDNKAYFDKYHEKGEFKDNWQEFVKLLPFESFSHIKFDKYCGLWGVVGLFSRLLEKVELEPVNNFASFKKETIEILSSEKNMNEEDIKVLLPVIEDLVFIDGNLSPLDRTFFKYLPVLPTNVEIADSDVSKYQKGQEKIAEYLFSMIEPNELQITRTIDNNLFLDIIKEILNSRKIIPTNKIEQKYYILPFIKKQFNCDLNWLFKQKEAVVVKYMPLFLYFYVCYSISQTICSLIYKKSKNDKPELLYFLLSSQTASKNSEAVLHGFMDKFGGSELSKIFAKTQAIDIVNGMFSEPDSCLYMDLMEKFEKINFEENKNQCIEIIRDYYEEKGKKVFGRKGEKERDIDSNILNFSNFKEFFGKLETVCELLNSKEYRTKIPNKFIDLLKIRLLEQRGANKVLVLDNELILFLIALFTKSSRTRLDKMYKAFTEYGICFSRSTRLLIEEMLIKLGLLERKSDSGEAQYVEIIL